MTMINALSTVQGSFVARPRSRFGFVIVLSLLAIGCGGPAYEVAEVSGVLMLKGKPGDKVMIQFIPDTQTVENLPSSVAETDADGRFVLRLMLRDGGQKSGAVVGSHRVILNDLKLAESETGRGVAMRFDPSYAMVGSTPLTQQVAPGEQTIELTAP